MFKEKLKVFAKIPQSLKKTQTNRWMKSKWKGLWKVHAGVMPKKYETDENNKDNLRCENGL